MATVPNRATVVTEDTETMTIPLTTMDMVVVMITVSRNLQYALTIILVSLPCTVTRTLYFLQTRALQAMGKHQDVEATRVATSHTDHTEQVVCDYQWISVCFHILAYLGFKKHYLVQSNQYF